MGKDLRSTSGQNSLAILQKTHAEQPKSSVLLPSPDCSWETTNPALNLPSCNLCSEVEGAGPLPFTLASCVWKAPATAPTGGLHGQSVYILNKIISAICMSKRNRSGLLSALACHQKVISFTQASRSPGMQVLLPEAEKSSRSDDFNPCHPKASGAPCFPRLLRLLALERADAPRRDTMRGRLSCGHEGPGRDQVRLEPGSTGAAPGPAPLPRSLAAEGRP